MPTLLRKDQHEILGPDDASGLLFGTEDTGYLTIGYPSFEVGDSPTADVAAIREDGVNFGEDYLGTKTYVLEIGVLTDRAADPERAGSDALNALEGVWTDERFRDDASKYAILRSNVAGRVRRAYGRPRRYAETPGLTTKKGYTPVLAYFESRDGRWYDDQEQSETARLRVATDGGLIAPLVTPLVTRPSSQQDTTIVVGGTKSTWLTVEFHGPVTNPSVQIGNLFTVGLNHSLAAGRVITVDARPWSRRVVRDDGAGMRAKVAYGTPPLRKMTVRPGTYTVRYRGIDITGTSYARVRWRNATPRP